MSEAIISEMKTEEFEMHKEERSELACNIYFSIYFVVALVLSFVSIIGIKTLWFIGFFGVPFTFLIWFLTANKICNRYHWVTIVTPINTQQEKEGYKQ